MKYKLPTITPEDRTRWPNCDNDATVQSFKLIASLPKAQVLAAMKGTRNKYFRALFDAMGHDTNPTWITNACAERAYDEGWIETEEFDKYARQ